MSNIDELINDGFVIVDKPPNMISHEVTSWVGRLLGAKRAGHAGTLDPNVTGVLPIALGKATKLLRFITSKRKVYVGIIKFPHAVDRDFINDLFSRFTGRISQIPPKMSAVAKKKRFRTVFSLLPLEIKDNYVLFKADVEAGTYIRVLCRDMGGEMVDLRRIAVGNIREEHSVVLQRLLLEFHAWKSGLRNNLRSLILSPEEMFDLIRMRKVKLKEDAAVAVSHGAQLAVPGVVEWDEFNIGDYVAMYFNDKLIGVGKAILSSSDLNKGKGILLKTLRIHKIID